MLPVKMEWKDEASTKDDHEDELSFANEQNESLYSIST